MVVVAIDGPSGVGKTTVSRAVADALGVPHLDTGSYYRVATLATLRASGDPAAEADVLDALDDRSIDFVDGRLHLDGSDASGLLRTNEVTAAVSAVASHAGVRRLLVEHQRSWVAERGGSAVVEGRDIGTVVFPDTPIKVFLTADPAVRARRRAADEEASGRDVAEIETALMARDTADSTREVAPLQPAADAVVIDTSELSVADVVRRILDLVGAV
ncbi:MAG: (d)CMP kinase [Acidimicrobiia bacterium]